MAVMTRLLLLSLAACAAQPVVTVAPERAEIEEVAPPPPPKKSASAPHEGLEGEEYRDTLLREFRLRNRSRPVADRAFEPNGDVPVHHVYAFRRIGRDRSHLILTVGLGQRRRAAASEELRYVELYAESAEYGEAIADVLSALGRALHDPETAESFRPYGSVQLPIAQHNLQYFDLVPAGQIDVATNHVVTLMKVVPVSAEEFEQTKQGETQFAGRDDITPEGSERALLRWSPALTQGPSDSH